MVKGKYKGHKSYLNDPMEIERHLITTISDTGKEQMKKRRKAGLSSFYAKDGKIIEVLADNTTHIRQTIQSKWVVLEKKKRTIIFK